MSFKKSSVAIIGFCSGLGQKHQGLELAPEALRASGLNQILQRQSAVVEDHGDIHPQDGADPWSILLGLKEKALSILQNGSRLLTIGGDHSLAVATVQATLSIFPEARLVWVDAHGDINTPETSLSGNIHGMPLAALLGLFKCPLAGPLLAPKNLLLIGVRDLDPAEKEFLRELQIEVITAEEANSPKAFLRIERWLGQSLEPIHLSFDVDSLDPSFGPATGIRVPDGISLDFSKQLVSSLARTQCLVSMDFVELNPLRVESADELAVTLLSAQQIISNAFVSNKTMEATL
jgi:arginase